MSWLQRICRLFAGEKPETFEGRSPKWEKVRGLFLVHHPECEVCGTREDLDVHHVLPFQLRPDMELDQTNLITLCRPHHLLFGHLMNWKSYNDNVRADARTWQQKIRNRPQ